MSAGRWRDVLDLLSARKPAHVAVVGSDRSLDEALAHAGVKPGWLDDAELVLVVGDDAVERIGELAAQGLFRADFAGPLDGVAVLVRGSAADAVVRYEQLARRLEREEQVARALSLEYEQAVAERDRALEQAAADPFGAAPRLPPEPAVPELLDDVIKLRMRAAPEGSLRTRAIDWSASRLRTATRSMLRLFDARDAALARVLGGKRER